VIVVAECQKLDWENHKVLCQSFDIPRPATSETGKHHRRGLFFPEESEPPRFVRLEAQREERSGKTLGKFDPAQHFTLPMEVHAADSNSVQARPMVLNGDEKTLPCWCNKDR
jgi:hypothetical protein